MKYEKKYFSGSIRDRNLMMSCSRKNEGVAWWEEVVVVVVVVVEAVAVVVVVVVILVVVVEFRLPVRQLSPFSRPLVSFYRVWSIELGSHFAQVCVWFFLIHHRS